MWWKIIALSISCLAANVAMGRKRENYRRFSWPWIFWIHASIPPIIIARLWLRLHPIAIPLNITAALAGQFVGSLLKNKNC